MCSNCNGQGLNSATEEELIKENNKGIYRKLKWNRPTGKPLKKKRAQSFTSQVMWKRAPIIKCTYEKFAQKVGEKH